MGILLVGVEHLLVEDLKELSVLILTDGWAPGVSELEKSLNELLFSQSVFVLGRRISLFLLLLFLLLSGAILIIVVVLPTSTTTRLSITFEVLSDYICKLISVNAWSEDVADADEDSAVLVLGAELSLTLKLELL